MGATLPGCPLFAVARTTQLAWGVTYMKGDTIDFFVEDCQPGGDTEWQYRRGDQWLDFQLREEKIERKGAESDILRVYENEQGTLDSLPDRNNSGEFGGSRSENVTVLPLFSDAYPENIHSGGSFGSGSPIGWWGGGVSERSLPSASLF